jgi:hypothetical protein
MTRDEFFAAVCTKFGWAATPWRLAVFSHWATQEGMPFDETFNPLATTRLSDATKLNKGFDIGFGPGNWNGVPVRVYASGPDGVQATFETLSLDFYPNIRRCFTEQKGFAEAVKEFTTYVGSESYGQRVVEFMNTSSAGKGGLSDADRLARLENIVCGFGIEDANGKRLHGEDALVYATTNGLSALLSIQHLQAAAGALALQARNQPGVAPEVVDALDNLVVALKGQGKPSPQA